MIGWCWQWHVCVCRLESVANVAMSCRRWAESKTESELVVFLFCFSQCVVCWSMGGGVDVVDLSWSVDSARLASCSLAHELFVWNIASNDPRQCSFVFMYVCVLLMCMWLYWLESQTQPTRLRGHASLIKGTTWKFSKWCCLRDCVTLCCAQRSERCCVGSNQSLHCIGQRWWHC